MWVESCPSPGVAAGTPRDRANPSAVRGPRSAGRAVWWAPLDGASMGSCQVLPKVPK